MYQFFPLRSLRAQSRSESLIKVSRRRSKRTAGLAAILMVSACASPQIPLRDGLIHAGIKPPVADCMAARMTRQLSLLQLRRLAGVGKAADSRDLDQFLYRLRALNDEQIVTVTGTSAALCSLGLGR